MAGSMGFVIAKKKWCFSAFGSLVVTVAAFEIVSEAAVAFTAATFEVAVAFIAAAFEVATIAAFMVEFDRTGQANCSKFVASCLGWPQLEFTQPTCLKPDRLLTEKIVHRQVLGCDCDWAGFASTAEPNPILQVGVREASRHCQMGYGSLSFRSKRALDGYRILPAHCHRTHGGC